MINYGPTVYCDREEIQDDKSNSRVLELSLGAQLDGASDLVLGGLLDLSAMETLKLVVGNETYRILRQGSACHPECECSRHLLDRRIRRLSPWGRSGPEAQHGKPASA